MCRNANLVVPVEEYRNGNLVVPVECRNGNLVVPVEECRNGNLVVPVEEYRNGNLELPVEEWRNGNLVVPIEEYKTGITVLAIEEHRTSNSAVSVEERMTTGRYISELFIITAHINKREDQYYRRISQKFRENVMFASPGIQKERRQPERRRQQAICTESCYKNWCSYTASCSFNMVQASIEGSELTK
jgi:hypothetical protein